MAATVVVEVTPGVGAGPVRLGMTKPEVLAAMGEPESRQADWLDVGETWYWHEHAFQASFGGDGRVGDVLVSFGGPVVAEWRGVDLLRTPADDVVTALATLGPGRQEEDGLSYRLPIARLSFWRQCLPGEEEEDDEQFRGGLYWDTVNTWRTEYQHEVAAAAERQRG